MTPKNFWVKISFVLLGMWVMAYAQDPMTRIFGAAILAAGAVSLVSL